MSKPFLRVDDLRLIQSGTFFKYARIDDEIWLEWHQTDDLERVLQALKGSHFAADVFSFAQRLPHVEPHYPYYFEWDSLAIVDTRDFQKWWKGLPQESRKNVRRSERRGVVVSAVEFDDQFVRGIKQIYDETPFRQGRRFWHFRKDLQVVAKENSSYLDRSQFLGAYYNDELVGFLKMVYVDNTARIMQILSKVAALDKRPANALIAKAVELCAKRNVSDLIYSQYYFGKATKSPLTEFKRRNGFRNVRVPRFYVPLSLKGRLAIAIRAHRGLRNVIPGKILSPLLHARGRMYEFLSKRSESGSAEGPT